jgi:hypothetical protein
MPYEQYYIPVVRIAPTSVLTYAVPHIRPSRTEKQDATNSNLTRGKFKGEISEKSRRKLKRTAQNWLLSIQEGKKGNISAHLKQKRYITFVTLTLSSKQTHSDNEIKREMLNPFLISAKRQFGVQEFIWRAESQANGNIHFHLFLDVYIPWVKVRKLWNECQERLGYITKFKALYGHGSPNSTDIERIRSVKGATVYITKYIAKESKHRKLDGRVWGTSDNLKTLSSYEDQIDSRYSKLFESLEENPEIRIINEPNYRIYLGNISQILSQYHPGIASLVKNHNQNNFRSLYG